MVKKSTKRPFKRKLAIHVSYPYKFSNDKYESVYDMDKCRLRENEDGGKVKKQDCSQIWNTTALKTSWQSLNISVEVVEAQSSPPRFMYATKYQRYLTWWKRGNDMDGNGLEIKVNITTEITFWQALKLRLAGMEYAQEFIRQSLEQRAKLNVSN
jgi:hypothetical protein